METDAPILRHLAQKCFPLDVHTPYTYWVLCHLFKDCCFILYDNNNPIGFITAIDTKKEIFIWQIGIINEARGKGYSQILIDKVVQYAYQQNKPLSVTIAPDNTQSYNAFKKYCNNHNLIFVPTLVLEITDFQDKNFYEKESVYKIKFN